VKKRGNLIEKQKGAWENRSTLRIKTKNYNKCYGA
jgi:hypothetical protein